MTKVKSMIDGTQEISLSKEGKMCVLVRTYSAGVHFGYLANRKDREVELVQARRTWYWEGAATLTQMAEEGVKLPAGCKFSMVAQRILLLDVIEVIPMTPAAESNLYAVPVWKK